MGLLRNIKERIADRITGRVPRGMKRSPQWPEVRKEHLKKYPKCAVCGSLKKLQVHHITLFSDDPSLELNPKNLITLCTSKKYGFNCHHLIGHSTVWTQPNIDVRKDARELSEKIMFARMSHESEMRARK